MSLTSQSYRGHFERGSKEVSEEALGKVCKSCGLNLPLTRYSTYKAVQKGVVERKHLHKCKKCENATPSLEVIEARRLYHVEVGTHKCSRCKEVQPLNLSRFVENGRKAGHPTSTCRPCTVEARRAWVQKNPEKVKESCLDYYYKNWDRKYEQRRQPEALEKVKQTSRARREANPDAVRFQASSRRAAKKNAIPTWADSDKIKLVYKKAIELSGAFDVQFSVDHVVPLRNRYVCGLHVHDNLQLLELSLNLQKQASHWPDMSEITPELRKMARDYAKTDNN